MCFPLIQLFNDSFSLFWSLSNKAWEGNEDEGRGACVCSSIVKGLIVTTTTQMGHGISFPVPLVPFLEKF